MRLLRHVSRWPIARGRMHGGLGLGLAIVHELVRSHGANVRAESEGEGRGATFIVELPVRRSVHATANAPGESDAGATSDAMQVKTMPLTGLHVLLVEDEPATREALTCSASRRVA